MYKSIAEIVLKESSLKEAAGFFVKRAEMLDGYPFERATSYEKAGDLLVQAGPRNGTLAVNYYRKAIPAFKEDWEKGVKRCQKKIAGLGSKRK